MSFSSADVQVGFRKIDGCQEISSLNSCQDVSILNVLFFKNLFSHFRMSSALRSPFFFGTTKNTEESPSRCWDLGSPVSNQRRRACSSSSWCFCSELFLGRWGKCCFGFERDSRAQPMAASTAWCQTWARSCNLPPISLMDGHNHANVF